MTKKGGNFKAAETKKNWLCKLGTLFLKKIQQNIILISIYYSDSFESSNKMCEFLAKCDLIGNGNRDHATSSKRWRWSALFSNLFKSAIDNYVVKRSERPLLEEVAWSRLPFPITKCNTRREGCKTSKEKGNSFLTDFFFFSYKCFCKCQGTFSFNFECILALNLQK